MTGCCPGTRRPTLAEWLAFRRVEIDRLAQAANGLKPRTAPAKLLDRRTAAVRIAHGSRPSLSVVLF